MTKGGRENSSLQYNAKKGRKNDKVRKIIIL